MELNVIMWLSTDCLLFLQCMPQTLNRDNHEYTDSTKSDKHYRLPHFIRSRFYSILLNWNAIYVQCSGFTPSVLGAGAYKSLKSSLCTLHIKRFPQEFSISDSDSAGHLSGFIRKLIDVAAVPSFSLLLSLFLFFCWNIFISIHNCLHIHIWCGCYNLCIPPTGCFIVEWAPQFE